MSAPSSFCVCGELIESGSRYCPECGREVTSPSSATAQAPQPVVSPVAPIGALPTTPSTPYPAYTYRSGVDIGGKPLELWVVIGLFAAAGIYLLQLSLRALPDSFRLFTYSWFPHSLAFVLLVLVLLLGALGVALALVGWLLHQANRIGRGLAYVVVACLFTGVVFGAAVTTGEVLSMFAGLIAAAILALAPAVRDVFTGPNSPQAGDPTSVVVARVALVVWIVMLGVAALLDFVLTDVEGKYAAYGVFLALIGFGALTLYRRLALPDRQARLIVSAAAAIAFVFLLLGRHDVGFALMLGLTVSVPAFLWLPNDARVFFGDGPLVSVAPAMANVVPGSAPSAGPSFPTAVATPAPSAEPGRASQPSVPSAPTIGVAPAGAALFEDDNSEHHGESLASSPVEEDAESSAASAPTQVIPQRRFCAACGRERASDQRFCVYCGSSLDG